MKVVFFRIVMGNIWGIPSRFIPRKIDLCPYFRYPRDCRQLTGESILNKFIEATALHTIFATEIKDITQLGLGLSINMVPT